MPAPMQTLALTIAAAALVTAAVPGASAAEPCDEAKALNEAVLTRAQAWPKDAPPRDEVTTARGDLCRAYELCPTQTGLLHNLDVMSAMMGDLGAALRYCHEYVAATLEGDPRRERAAARCVRLRERVDQETAPVRLVTRPPGARVIVDGDACGALLTPASRRLAPGVHVFELSLEGYLPQRRQVEVAAGQVLDLEVALEPAPTVGTLTVVTEPPGATVWVDAEPAGSAPATVELEAGRHRVVARAAGFVDADVMIEVVAGEGREVALALEAIPPPPPDTGWSARRWVGVALLGAGVAAAGAGAGLHIVGAGEADDAAARMGSGLPAQAYAKERDAFDAGADKVSAGLWLYGAAGALAVAGALLTLIPDGEDAPVVTLSPAPHGAGAVLTATRGF